MNLLVPAVELSGVMHSSLAYVTLGEPKHVLVAILIGGGPIVLSITQTSQI